MDAAESIIEYMAPYKTLERVKRYLRRYCLKPAGMNVRTFYNHLTRINKEELPMMPPYFEKDQSLSDDEIVDILLNAFPKRWLKEMELHGFDPFTKRIPDFLKYCERLEVAESLNLKHNKSAFNKQPRLKGKPKSDDEGPESDNNYYCVLHGRNVSHDTKHCRALNARAAEIKKEGENRSARNHSDGNYRDKKRPRKASRNRKSP